MSRSRKLIETECTPSELLAGYPLDAQYKNQICVANEWILKTPIGYKSRAGGKNRIWLQSKVEKSRERISVFTISRSVAFQWIYHVETRLCDVRLRWQTSFEVIWKKMQSCKQ